MKHIILAILMSTLIFSCSEKELSSENLVKKNGLVYAVNKEIPYSGQVFKKTELGKFILKGTYKEGYKYGRWIVFFENGQKASIKNYSKNGTLDGLEEIYTESGKLVSKGNFKDNKKSGEWLNYYKDEKLKFKEVYANGKLHGNKKEYYPNDKLKRDYNFKNGKYDSICIDYFSNGHKSKLTNYSKGLKNGVYKEWNKNGKKIKEFNYNYNIIKSKKRWNVDGIIRPNLPNGLIGNWKESIKGKDGTTFSITFKENGSFKAYRKNSNGKIKNKYTGKYQNVEDKIIIDFDKRDLKNWVLKIFYLSEQKLNTNFIKGGVNMNFIKF